MQMESDFEGEITHAIECIEQGLLESPVLGEEMSVEIVRVVEEVQKNGKRVRMYLTEKKVRNKIP